MKPPSFIDSHVPPLENAKPVDRLYHVATDILSYVHADSALNKKVIAAHDITSLQNS